MKKENIEEPAATAVGCLRGTISVSIGMVLACLAGIWAGTYWHSILLGITTGIGVFLFCLCVSVLIMNSAKRLTTLDCILPVFISAISGVLFAPLSFVGNGSFFSSITCMGAGLFLCIVLFMYKQKRIPAGYLVLPFLTFAYELLPIELPTDIDNILALGGSGVNTWLAYLNRNPVQALENFMD